MAESPERPSWLGRQWDRLMATARRPGDVEKILADARAHSPAPTFWLLGKTQSGKSSIVRYLTGATAAEVGSGFRPCTRTTNRYPFPDDDAPLMTFLDTRGLDDPAYDPADDLREFESTAHLILVTTKLTDFAHETLLGALRRVRKQNPSRPVLLVLSCLHEAYPLQPHPEPYPFNETDNTTPKKQLPFAGAAVAGVTDPGYSPNPEANSREPHNSAVPPDAARLIAEQERVFAGLFDERVAVDLTKPEEGFAEPNYGGPELKAAILRLLPTAYRETLLRFEGVADRLRSAHLSAAIPVIAGYATAAATAAAVPVPFIDLVAIPALQAQMVHHLARQYEQPLSDERFRELAASVGVGLVIRQAIREVAKLIPVVGSVAASALAAASTFALGRAFCEYIQQVKDGHHPDADTLKRLYQTELTAADRLWRNPGATP
jgi:uncharacterized protein (DUF697 family)